MSQSLYSIGDVARESGLSVSALRFYDREAVLTPLSVDPLTGYRWYSSAQVRSAELIGVLRRVGLPLSEISHILALQGDDTVLKAALAAQVKRLEAGLASAKTLIAQIERQWATPPAPALAKSVSVSAPEFHKALSSVRFACGGHDEFPALAGICLTAVDGKLQLLATDRHRAAFDCIRTEPAADEFRVVLAQDGIDALLDLLLAGEIVEIVLDTGLQVTLGDTTISCPLLDAEYPDFSLPFEPTLQLVKAEVDRLWVKTELGKIRSESRTLVGIDQKSQLRLDNDAHQEDMALLVNAAYLHEAVEAANGDQLSFELNGPIAPLAIRNSQNSYSFSVIMPIFKDER